MKKRIVTLLLAACLTFTLFGCGAQTSDQNQNNPTTEVSNDKNEKQKDESKTTETQNQDGTNLTKDEREEYVKTISELISKNAYLCMQVFGIGTLSSGDYTVEEDPIAQVTDSKFPDYKSLDDFVRGVYCKEHADQLMLDFKGDGTGVQKYINKDGMLYVDRRLDASKGYNVNWNSFAVEITKMEDARIEFTATASEEEPGENVTSKDYVVTGAVVKENGVWLLEKEIF